MDCKYNNCNLLGDEYFLLSFLEFDLFQINEVVINLMILVSPVSIIALQFYNSDILFHNDSILELLFCS